MSVTPWLGRLLGLESTQAIQRVELSLAAPWAHDAPAWLLFGCLGLAAVAMVFYFRWQSTRHHVARAMLAVGRAVLLALVLWMLAEPILTVRIASQLRPALWLVIDGTDSMAMVDDLTGAELERLSEAVGLRRRSGTDDGSPGSPSGERPARVDFVQALVTDPDADLLGKLEEKFRLRAFLVDRPDGVRALELSSEGDSADAEHLAGQLTTDGEVTALGAAFDDLARRHATANLAGLVVVSDFNQNAGPLPVEAAERLAVPVYTVGVGAVAAADVSVELDVPLLLIKDERKSLRATLRQTGLDGATVDVRFLARKLGGTGRSEEVSIGQRTVRLDGPTAEVELPYVPDETGRFRFAAEVEPVEGENVVENNRRERESTVRDDFLRLLFVEYEPTWEWRFVKEVFHRDRLIGQRGFRTFLRSADPKVRRDNPLFVETLTPSRKEFFAHDVIVLGDMPASALSPSFCRLTKEFVDKFAGGLVVVAGPRFGPGELARSELGDLLPVRVDPSARLRDAEPFELVRTPAAADFDFMRLGSSPAENAKAWKNLGPLAWYQPVERLRPAATALAVHPRDKCVDGQTPQPIIAAGRYGTGEVVYLGFDETWRLRRLYGEQYYRQFWGQMIHRLALRHALGTEKRFVVRTDRQAYKAEDQVRVTVEAYDADYEELTEEDLPEGKLTGELILPETAEVEGPGTRPLGLAMSKEGVFETRFPVFAAGEYRLRVWDPVAEQFAEETFRVAAVSAERQRPVRNVALARRLAEATGGKSYDLETAKRLPDEVKLVSRTETSVEVVPLWNTWLVFAVVVLLMLGEWLVRKWVNLP